MIIVPTYQSRSEEIGDALIDNVISNYCMPDYIIRKQNSAFMSLLINYLFNIALQAEDGIKSSSAILTKHLTGLGSIWPKSLPLAMFVYNTFSSPKLANYSPYELVFNRKPNCCWI